MTSIAAALDELLNRPELPLQATLERHFTDDFRQCSDGHWIDRAAVAEQFRQLRTMVTEARIEVLDELEQGPHYAERHVITVVRPDGSTAAQEVYVFARIAHDGRIARLEELTRPVQAAAHPA